MAKRRYMPSAGLAFAEEREMKKLSKMAQKGWVLEKFSFMGYTLKKSNPRHLIYSLDYQNVKGDGAEEYYDVFRAAGWEPVTSIGSVHVFSAEEGTPPIHTEDESKAEKYAVMKNWFGSIACFLILLTIASVFLMQESVIIQRFIFPASLALTVPAAMTFITLQIRYAAVRKNL
ncbi:DUF2812 domain-containing protein [Metabacillus indicus]|uniref:DUF2812 domain-containing protein n=1 Tax=Metabacillus indicus TaxID=246786 RepID=UPI002A05FE1F|nr:DUF2812 domain-containing protein [Metabacillus indicus]MDX8291703.1 DUF2812 domain-containing protein [Metabacillus indicus]